MCTPKEFLDKARHCNKTMKEQLNYKSIKYNWHEANLTILEGLLARGDRKLNKVLLDVYNKGGIFDSWSEHFKYDLWLEAIAENNIDIDFYTSRERDYEEILPWDFIDVGVTKKFLIREYEQAKGEALTPNCRQKCSGCGAASFGGGVCFEGKTKVQ